MKITIFALGSRGDVQPAIALGKGLLARGHHVRMLAGKNFAPWITKHGIEPIESVVDLVALMASPIGREWIEKGSDPLAQRKIMHQLLEQTGWPVAKDCVRAAEDTEVLISSFTSDFYAASIAEARGIFHVSTPLQPSPLATRSGVASLAAVVPHRDSVFNWLFGKLIVENTFWSWFAPYVNRLRTELLHLRPWSRSQALDTLRRMPLIHGHSTHVAPRASDWPAHWDVAGYWFLDEAQSFTPPDTLTAFLEEGSKPVVIGFGSMTAGDPVALTKLLLEAVTRSGQRAILLSGWSDLGGTPLPSSVYQIDAVPHDWLYPRVSAVVTHGGAGTVAASLRAGRVTVVVPHMSDQLYWGRRVEELGVGPRAILRPKLTAGGLAAALRRATEDQAMQSRAGLLGQKIRDEDGVLRAVQFIENATKRV